MKWALFGREGHRC